MKIVYQKKDINNLASTCQGLIGSIRQAITNTFAEQQIRPFSHPDTVLLYSKFVYSYFISTIFLGFLQAQYPEQQGVNTQLCKYYLLLNSSMKLGTANGMKLLQLIEYFIFSIDLPVTLFSFQTSINKVVLLLVQFSAFKAKNFDQLLNDKIQMQY
ncbi:Hypothetical_protein [Hexamita inflata]|uniref:Hypothetical_protein n=1 Tax=Hexamita inflata TaxID=28002 RepID=A0AA86U9H9_9EUKA|nr:Hypothetical protein HINF_LOCUS36405 [Hexamita inflata]